MIPILIVSLLIFLNGLYVAAEFAAVSARPNRVRQLAESGNRIATLLLPVLEDPRRLDLYISGCQVGISLTSLILGAYGQSVLTGQLAPIFIGLGNLQEPVAQSTAALIVLVALTASQLILSELVPKYIALQYPTQVAILTVLPIKSWLKIIKWFIRLLNASAIICLRLLNLSPVPHRHFHSPEEIAMLLTESGEGGLLSPDEQYRLHQALQLGQRTAKQLMLPRLHMKSIDIDAPIDLIAQKALESASMRLPVYQGTIDNIVGILHVRDLAVHSLRDKNLYSIAPFVRPVPFVPEDASAERLLTLLRTERSQLAIVADDFGGVSGIVTIEDVLGEIFGKVSDEFQSELPEAEHLANGQIRLSGLMRLDEVTDWIGQPWVGRSETVGGLVMERLGHVPTTGEKLEIDGFFVLVEKMRHHAITSVLVTPIPAVEDGDADA